jgi:PEGA domain-containing protein
MTLNKLLPSSSSDNDDPTTRVTTKLRMLELALIVAITGLTQGCATVIKGSSQSIPVSSDPSAADILLDGKLVGQTPKTLALKRESNYLITIQMAGFEQQSVPIVKNIGGAVWGNVLAGGLVGWGVDAASGAQYNLLPASVSVKLVPVNTVVEGMAADDSNTFVSKLKALDQQHDAKQLSDQDYVSDRLELFRKYMPEALPADSAPQPK